MMFFFVFFRKNLFRIQFNFSRFEFWFIIKFSSLLLLNVRQTPLSNSKSVKVTKNVIKLEFLKWNLKFRSPSKIKIFLLDPVFSNWINFIKKVPVINCSRNSKSFKGIFFFNSKEEIFSINKSDFFLFYLRSLTLFQLSVDYRLSISGYS